MGKSATRRSGAIGIDAAGAPDLLDRFMELSKIGSRMVVDAVQAGKRPVDVLHMTYAQQALVGSGGYFPEDVQDVMRIMAGGRYDIASIISHEFPRVSSYPAAAGPGDRLRSGEISERDHPL